MKGLITRAPLVALAVTALLAPSAGASGGGHHGGKGLYKIRHFVVIYQENHSFDNLYGGWEGVDGIANADPPHTTQVDQAGTPYQCLLQIDVNLTSPPLAATCTNTTPPFMSHFANAPFRIDDYIAPEDTTCPAPGMSAPNGVPKGSGLPGGCTRDLVHRFYQEEYQLNGGRQDRYVTGSDAVGLAMGHYDTRRLPVYEYLHARGHPAYAISDRFFQAAHGGSFLNHQWLIAAASPVFYNARNDGSADDLHSRVDANGMPTSYPLYAATRPVKDAELTVPCDSRASRGPGLRRLRRQHDPAALRAVPAGHRRGAPATAAEGAHDRGSPEREGGRLGLVLRRLVERERRRRRTGLDEWQHARHVRGPANGGRGGLAELPQRAVPVPPPAVQLLRGLCAANRRTPTASA